MHHTTALAALMASLLSGHVVMADWASQGTAIGTGQCATTATIAAPVFENDAWDSVCNDLVADGCAKAFVLSNADAGSSSFARNTDLSCEEVAPLGQLTCTNAFRNAYGLCASAFSPGEKPTCSVQLMDADGKNLGVLGFAGACMPIIIPREFTA